MRETTHRPRPGRERPRATLVLPEWMEAGLAGAFAMAAVFFVRDSSVGEPLYTASVLGTLVLEGAAAARATTYAPGAAALFHAIHFAVWMGVGLLGAMAMRRAEDDASLRWLPLLLLAAVMVLMVCIDALVTGTVPTRVHVWLGGAVGVAVASSFLVWRHPGAFGRDRAS